MLYLCFATGDRVSAHVKMSTSCDAKHFTNSHIIETKLSDELRHIFSSIRARRCKLHVGLLSLYNLSIDSSGVRCVKLVCSFGSRPLNLLRQHSPRIFMRSYQAHFPPQSQCRQPFYIQDHCSHTLYPDPNSPSYALSLSTCIDTQLLSFSPIHCPKTADHGQAFQYYLSNHV